MVPASFPEIESPSLRKSGVVLESEELRSSAIGQTSRDVGHASNLLDDELFFDCDWRAENITFRDAVAAFAPVTRGNLSAKILSP
jgi:hypothetical protein